MDIQRSSHAFRGSFYADRKVEVHFSALVSLNFPMRQEKKFSLSKREPFKKG